MSNVILGIDPGLSGAFAWVTRDGHLIEVEDMPTAKIRDRNKVIAATVAALMGRRELAYVIIEQVGAMPRDGTMGAFAFGYGAGLLEGVAAGMMIPVHMVTPSVWKRRAGIPADKNGARVLASQAWPGAADRFRRVRDDGRAEAALLGRWAALGGVQA